MIILSTSLTAIGAVLGGLITVIVTVAGADTCGTIPLSVTVYVKVITAGNGPNPKAGIKVTVPSLLLIRVPVPPGFTALKFVTVKFPFSGSVSFASKLNVFE